MACLAALPGQRSEYAGSPPRCSTRPRGLLPGCLTGYRKMVMMTSADDGPAPATRAHEGDRPRRAEAHAHHHRDVSGGWLRPAVFGAMGGLVTNVSLIAGVGGASVASYFVILTGLAGLAAGACSMAAGEFVSVSSQNELVGSEIDKEQRELETNPAAEQRELA